MGMVYLASNHLGHPVVIKEYLPQILDLRKQGVRVRVFDPEQKFSFESGMMEFFKENEILSRLDHENIVKVSDSFLENNTAYSVMQFIYGQSLKGLIAQKVRSQTTFLETDLHRYFLGLAKGVEYLHSHQILHLDLKPGNIYITFDQKPIILDFGNVWVNSEKQEVHLRRPPMLTPGYAPPEQYKKYFSPEKITTATDLYAVGATMAACMFQQTPVHSTVRLDKNLPIVKKAGTWFASYNEWLAVTINDLTHIEAKKRLASAKTLCYNLENAYPQNINTNINSKIDKTIYGKYRTKTHEF